MSEAPRMELQNVASALRGMANIESARLRMRLLNLANTIEANLPAESEG